MVSFGNLDVYKRQGDEQLFDLQVPSELRYGTSLLEEEGRIFLSLVFRGRAFQYFSEYGGYIEHVLTILAECRIRKGMYLSAFGTYIFSPVCAPFRAPAGGYARVALRISQFQVTVRQMEAVERVEVRHPFLVPPAGGHFHRQ